LGKKDEILPNCNWSLQREGENTSIGQIKRTAEHPVQNVSIVPDITKKQQREEERLRKRAEGRNKELTEEDRSKNLKMACGGKEGREENHQGTRERRLYKPQTVNRMVHRSEEEGGRSMGKNRDRRPLPERRGEQQREEEEQQRKEKQREVG
jgi:hypothetical protein